MPSTNHLTRPSLFRKYAFRMLLWVVFSSAITYAMRSAGRLWKDATEIAERPDDQQITLKPDEPTGDWWSPNPSLDSITRLVTDYYGEVPELPVIAIEGHNPDRHFLAPVESAFVVSDSSEPSLKDLVPETLKQFGKDQFQEPSTYHSSDSSDSYVRASLFGYLPESGVDLSTDTFRLGNIVAVPEPASGLIFLGGVAGVSLMRRRKRN
jgi:hypothetical protein